MRDFLANIREIATLIAAIIGLPTIVLGALPIWLGWGRRAAKPIAWVLLLIGISAYLIDLADRLDYLPRVAVYSDLRPLYDAVATLGKPHNSVEVSKGNYQARHERALPDNLSERKVVQQHDSDWRLHPTDYDDEYLKRAFRVPPGKLPPRWGVAKHWRIDPPRWEWIGWREWECVTDVRFQQFEHGTIAGPFYLSPDRPEGEVIAILDDGTWRSRRLGLLPTKCPTPE
jgi:hypothetical protein